MHPSRSHKDRVPLARANPTIDLVANEGRVECGLSREPPAGFMRTQVRFAHW